MKKIFTVLVLAAFALSGASAKKWTNNIGVGFTLPISTIGVDEKDADDISQIGYGVEGTYVGIHESGFTVKADVDVGLSTSKDIAIQDDDTNLGAFYGVYLGAGWTFVNDGKLTVSATGMMGFEGVSYTSSEENIYYGAVKYDDFERTITLAMFGIGADLFASYRVKEHFGVFGNLELRYLVAGASKESIEGKVKSGNKTTTITDSSDGPDLAGKFCIQPTIGVVWNF